MKTKTQLEADLKKAMSDGKALEEEVKLLMRRLDEQQEIEKSQEADLKILMKDLKDSSLTGCINITEAATLWPAIIRQKASLEKTCDFIRITRNALSIGTARLHERVEAADALATTLKSYGKLVLWKI